MNEPSRKLHSWQWDDPSQAGSTWASVQVWIPAETTRGYDIDRIADYLAQHLFWQVARTVGWSGGYVAPGDDLALVWVRVLSSTVRADGSAHRGRSDTIRRQATL
jgi:hypothetical protein